MSLRRHHCGRHNSRVLAELIDVCEPHVYLHHLAELEVVVARTPRSAASIPVCWGNGLAITVEKATTVAGWRWVAGGGAAESTATWWS